MDDQGLGAPRPWEEIYAEHEKALEEQKQAWELAEQRRAQAVQRGLASHDVVVGMGAQDVTHAWGEPTERDYAGQPGNGNERWVYSEGLSTFPSLSKKRIIYFENGRVAGWSTQ